MNDTVYSDKYSPRGYVYFLNPPEIASSDISDCSEFRKALPAGLQRLE